MNIFLEDVKNQPISLRNALKSYMSDASLEKMRILAGKKFSRIVFTGMGSSHYSCIGASIYLNQKGIVSIVKSASQLLHYENQLIDKDTLLYIVSQSGESGEVVNLLSRIPDNTSVVAVTNNPDSTLARRSDYVFEMNVAEEEAVSTRTYLASILINNIIAKVLAKELCDATLSNIESVIDEMEAFLANHEKISERIKDFIGNPSYICLMGRGHSYSSSCAGGLFIKELAKFPSISFDSGEFRHGPFEMIDKDFTGIIFAPEGPTYNLNCKLAIDIAERGGRVLLVTNKSTEKVHSRILELQMAHFEEFFTPMLEILPVQLTANIIAESKNLEVGKFRWASKITSAE